MSSLLQRLIEFKKFQVSFLFFQYTFQYTFVNDVLLCYHCLHSCVTWFRNGNKRYEVKAKGNWTLIGWSNSPTRTGEFSSGLAIQVLFFCYVSEKGEGSESTLRKVVFSWAQWESALLIDWMFDYFVNIRVQAWIRTEYLRRVGVLADFKENVWLLRESEQRK